MVRISETIARHEGKDLGVKYYTMINTRLITTNVKAIVIIYHERGSIDTNVEVLKEKYSSLW